MPATTPSRDPRRPALRRIALPALLAALLIAGGCSPVDDAGRGAPSAIEDPFAPTPAMRAAAIATTDIEAMLDDLSRIEGWHARERTGLVPALRGGVPLAELDAAEAALGCRLPDDLRALWRWRDGHADDGAGPVFTWYHQLLPLHEALARYRELRAAPYVDWDASWLPVLYFQEEWYFVECGPAPVAASPLMFLFTESGAAPAYASLTTYFATMADAMAAGAVARDGHGLGADERALAAIHARHNPGLPFPYHVPEPTTDDPD